MYNQDVASRLGEETEDAVNPPLLPSSSPPLLSSSLHLPPSARKPLSSPSPNGAGSGLGHGAWARFSLALPDLLLAGRSRPRPLLFGRPSASSSAVPRPPPRPSLGHYSSAVPRPLLLGRPSASTPRPSLGLYFPLFVVRHDSLRLLSAAALRLALPQPQICSWLRPILTSAEDLSLATPLPDLGRRSAPGHSSLCFLGPTLVVAVPASTADLTRPGPSHPDPGCRSVPGPLLSDLLGLCLYTFGRPFWDLAEIPTPLSIWFRPSPLARRMAQILSPACVSYRLPPLLSRAPLSGLTARPGREPWPTPSSSPTLILDRLLHRSPPLILDRLLCRSPPSPHLFGRLVTCLHRSLPLRSWPYNGWARLGLVLELGLLPGLGPGPGLGLGPMTL